MIVLNYVYQLYLKHICYSVLKGRFACHGAGSGRIIGFSDCIEKENGISYNRGGMQMSQILQWHPAFQAAMQIELSEEMDKLEFSSNRSGGG